MFKLVITLKKQLFDDVQTQKVFWDHFCLDMSQQEALMERSLICLQKSNMSQQGGLDGNVYLSSHSLSKEKKLEKY